MARILIVAVCFGCSYVRPHSPQKAKIATSFVHRATYATGMCKRGGLRISDVSALDNKGAMSWSADCAGSYRCAAKKREVKWDVHCHYLPVCGNDSRSNSYSAQVDATLADDVFTQRISASDPRMRW